MTELFAYFCSKLFYILFSNRYIELIVRASSAEAVASRVARWVRRLRSGIWKKTKCSASAGIGANCYQAKLASTAIKPHGQSWFRGVPVRYYYYDDFTVL
jgi:nucleotidyltransferase/DNA polymerase involved in DNA repair